MSAGGPDQIADSQVSNNYLNFYIDGQWIAPEGATRFDVENPATGEIVGQTSLGTRAHVDAAVQAAVRAFESFSQTSREERIALLERIAQIYEARSEEMAHAMALEMGSTITFTRTGQVPNGLGHFTEMARVLKAIPLNT
jgi:NAD-dependent aldehyde dehydrogenases